MSSPITSKRKTFLDRTLIRVHQQTSHSHRIELLAQRIDQVVARHVAAGEAVRALDIGCGDMALSRRLAAMRPRLRFDAIDIHELPPALRDDPDWANYRSFDGTHIPFPDATFTFGLMCDVLHHVPPASRIALLGEVLRPCEVLIIKDHFEYGWLSRSVLRAMDFIGNYGYGVVIPERYFTAGSITDLCSQAGGVFQLETPAIDLYAHLPLVSRICRPQWQVIGSVRRRPSC